MATHSFHSYSPNALVYDPNTDTFTLDSDFDHREDRNFIEVTDDDAFFDGDKSNDEVGEDSNQTAVVRDGNGDVIGSGQIYVEQYAILQAPDGTQITIDRIEIDGVHMGYIPSALLQPGVQYTYVGGDDIDDGGDPNGNGGTTGDTRANYSYYETNSVPCYCSGTMIETKAGVLPVDWVSRQDLVLTRDHGLQKVIWVGHSKYTAKALSNDQRLWPVIIKAGALDQDTPAQDLRVSGDHRILIQSPHAELMFGSHEVFVPAKALVNGDTIVRPKPRVPVTFFHVLCAGHHLIRADGQWAESLLPSQTALRRLPVGLQRDIDRRMTPELRAMKTALPCLKVKEARTLLRSVPKPQEILLAQVSGRA